MSADPAIEVLRLRHELARRKARDAGLVVLREQEAIEASLSYALDQAARRKPDETRRPARTVAGEIRSLVRAALAESEANREELEACSALQLATKCTYCGGGEAWHTPICQRVRSAGAR